MREPQSGGGSRTHDRAPYVRHAHTSDGVSIAYWSMGEGDEPLIIVPTIQASHILLELENERLAGFYDLLASHRPIVRYDSRGTGLSGHDVVELSLETLGRDIDAVADDLGFERFSLLSWFSGCSVALAYAASHPDRVSHLALWYPSLRAPHNPVIDALIPLATQEWEMFLRARYRVEMVDEEARFRAELTEASVTPEFFHRARAFWDGLDMASAAEQVQAKTLVLRRRSEDGVVRRDTRGLLDDNRIESHLQSVSSIDIPGEAREIYNERTSETANIIGAFLNDSQESLNRLATALNEAGQGDDGSALSEREREILRLLVDGYRSKEIAFRLSITQNTVERHIANIYRKTGAHGRAAVAAFAVKHRLI